MNTLKQLVTVLMIALLICTPTQLLTSAHAAGPDPQSKTTYQVLDPIESGSVTLYPIVRTHPDEHAAKWQFITLDEGFKSGEVVVTEAGKAAGLARNRHNRDGVGTQQSYYSGDSVNTLVLLNNSSRPLVLLAGEIVTGGRQDRVIAKDRIVMPHSEPLDLSVFCIEPHRWVETSSKFGTAGSSDGKSTAHSFMVQPSVRSKAMAAQDQQQVWNEVNRTVAASAPSYAHTNPDSGVLYDRTYSGSGGYGAPTSSYAQTMAAPEQQKQIDKIAAPALAADSTIPEQLRKSGAVGVVAAINGHILWADVFASPELLEAYWSKLVRSYAAESLHPGTELGPTANREEALKFVDTVVSGNETSEGNSTIYRYLEIQGSRDSEFILQALLHGTNFDVHLARMVHEKEVQAVTKPVHNRRDDVIGVPPYRPLTDRIIER
jgi:hypothetical protein